MNNLGLKLITIIFLCLCSPLSIAACPDNSDKTGLSISYFLSVPDPWTDQASNLQEAVNCLIADARYTELDLEGRQISISDSIIFPNTEISLSPKKIVNGRINLTTSFASPQQFKYAFSFGSVNQQINNFEFRNVSIRAQGIGNGILLPKYYVNFVIDNVTVDKPKTFGIRSNFDGQGKGHELRILNSKIVGGKFTDPINNRATCISLSNPDAKFQNNVLAYCKIGIELSNGAQLIQGNHIYSGYGADANNPSLTEHGTCIELNELNPLKPESITITGNYLDQCRTKLNFVKNLNISNNYFLVRASNAANFNFIEISDADYSSLVLTSNIVEDNHVETPNKTNFIKILSSASAINQSQVTFDNNIFDEVINVVSTNTVRRYPSSNQYHAYFDQEFPFGCKVRNHTVLSITPKNLEANTTWDIGHVETSKNIVRIDVGGGHHGAEYFEVSAYCEYD